MTTRALRKLPHGTKVTWVRDGDESSTGYVVTAHRAKHPDEDVYVQWPDGQRTYACDDWAVRHVSRNLALEMA